MTSALSACEKAVYDALSANVVGAPIYQHVPEDAAAPVVIIGDLEASPFDTKGDTDRDISLSVDTVDQAQERKPALGLMDQVAAALDNTTLTEAGWTLYVRLETESAVLLGDGKTYQGTQGFIVMATQ